MASFVVMQPPEKPGAAQPDAPTMVRDGFSVFGVILGPLWLVFHRLWLEAIMVLAAMIVLNAVGSRLGLEGMASALSFLVSLWIGLEGASLRLAGLRRRGYLDAGVIEAQSRDEAELRFAFAGEDDEDIQPWTLGPPVPAASKTGARAVGPAMGLFNYPGRA